MNKYIFALVLLWTAIASYGRSDKYVVVLSMDGFRHDLAAYADTPVLDSVMVHGSYSVMYPCFPSNTFPNHYSMATGLHPDSHGLVNNTFFDTTLGKGFSIGDRDAVMDPDFWGGEPIWNSAERAGLTANIFMWVGSEAPVNGRYASVWTPFSSEPSFYTRADWVIDALHRDVEDIPNLIMWYFEEPDAVEHKYGPISAETRTMVEHIDSVVGYFLKGVKTSPVHDKIDFIFTSDHGMSPLDSSRYINLFPLVDGSRIKNCIPGTPTYIEPEDDYFNELLEILHRCENLTVLCRDDMPDRYRYGNRTDRILPVIVLPDAGWRLDYREESNPVSGGAHGYDPFHPDMQMVFYGIGPDFRQGYVNPEPIQNLNLYTLVARLLGIEPAPNECVPGIWDAMLINEQK